MLKYSLINCLFHDLEDSILDNRIAGNEACTRADSLRDKAIRTKHVANNRVRTLNYRNASKSERCEEDCVTVSDVWKRDWVVVTPRRKCRWHLQRVGGTGHTGT